MKKIAVRAGVSLLVGVVVSYAVAEACTIRHSWSSTLRTTWYLMDRASESGVFRGFVMTAEGAEHVVFWLEPHDLTGSTAANAPTRTRRFPIWVSKSGYDHDYEHQYSAGWPMRCVRCRVVYEDYNLSTESRRSFGMLDLSGGPPDPDSWFTSRAAWTMPTWLPVAPWWPGLIVNTLFYGLPVFTLWCAIPAARRAVRRKRGLCPSCAYSRAALAPGSPCPECGEVMK